MKYIYKGYNNEEFYGLPLIIGKVYNVIKCGHNEAFYDIEEEDWTILKSKLEYYFESISDRRKRIIEEVI